MTARPWWEGPPPSPWWQPPAVTPAPVPIVSADALPGVVGSDKHADDAESYLRDLLSRLGKPVTPPR